MKEKCSSALWNKVRLVMVCEVSGECAECGKDGKGYRLELPSKLLKVVMASLVVLKVALQMNGVPAGLIPNLPDMGGAAALVQRLADSLPDQDVLEKVGAGVEGVKKAGEEAGQREELLGASTSTASAQEGPADVIFRLIQKEEGCEGAPLPLVGWRPRLTGLVQATPRAGVRGVKGETGCKWVLPKYQHSYEQRGEHFKGP